MSATSPILTSAAAGRLPPSSALTCSANTPTKALRGWWPPSCGSLAAVLLQLPLRLYRRRPVWINALCPITVADDQWLASAESDGIVRMWDPATGKLRRTLEAANWRGVTRLPAIVRT